MIYKKTSKHFITTLLSASVLLTTTLLTFSSVVLPATNQQSKLNNVSTATRATSVFDQIEFSASHISDTNFAFTNTQDGTYLYGWGSNASGMLGLGLNDSNVAMPTPIVSNNAAVPYPWETKTKIKAVFAAQNFSLVWLENNEIWVAGANDDGQLGIDDASTSSTNVFIKNEKVAALLTANRKITKLVVGGTSVYMVISELDQAGNITANALYAWGNNSDSQLGLASGPKYYEPTLNPFVIQNDDQLHATLRNFMIVRKSGDKTTLWTCGNAILTGDAIQKPTITQFIYTWPSPIKKLITGTDSVFALLDNGRVYAWGDNVDAHLGYTSQSVSPRFVDLSALSGEPIQQISMGTTHSLFMTKNEIYAVGNNTHGQLGINQAGNVSVFTKVVRNFTLTANDRLFTNKNSSFIITSDKMYAWGDNTSNQYGNNAGVLNYSKPTVIDPFGTVSEFVGVSSNANLAPGAAISDFYNKTTTTTFDSTKFKKYFDATTFPANTIFSLKPGTTPKSDDGKFIISVIAHVAYTAPIGAKAQQHEYNDISIEGFKRFVSTIESIPGISHDIMIDDWEDSVRTNGEFDKQKLDKYINFRNFPPGTKITIKPGAADYATGKLELAISMSQFYDYDGNLVILDTRPVDVIVQLLPRITGITMKTDFEAVRTNELYDLLMLDPATKELNYANLLKYFDIIAPAPGVSYFAADDGYNYDPTMGIFTFKIYATQYYGADGLEKVGSNANLNSHFGVFDFNLDPAISNIQKRTDHPTNIPVTDLIAYFGVDPVSGGEITDIRPLEPYFKFEFLPSDTKLSIANIEIEPYDSQWLKDTVSFDMIASSYNYQGSTASFKKNFTFKVGAKRRATTVTKRNDYDAGLSVETVNNRLSTLQGEELKTYLQDFLKMEGLIEDAVLTVENINPNVNLYGQSINFDLFIDKAYDDNGNIVTDKGWNFDFRLGQNRQATNIIQQNSYDRNTRVDYFVEQVKTLKTHDLYDFLVDDFVTAVSVRPNILTATTTKVNLLAGQVQLVIRLERHYNAWGEYIDAPISFVFDFEFLKIFDATHLTTFDEGTYPADLNVEQFKKAFYASRTSSFMLSPSQLYFMSRFIKFDNIPTDANFFFTWNDSLTDSTQNRLGFDIVADQHYVNGGLQKSDSVPFELQLKLAAADTIQPATYLKAKTDAPTADSQDTFLTEVFPNKIANIRALMSYVDGLQTIPTLANIVDMQYTKTTASGMFFDIEVSGYYDGVTKAMISAPKKFTVQIRLTKNDFGTDIASLWWVWAIAGTAGGLIFFFIILLLIQKGRDCSRYPYRRYRPKK